MINWNEVVVGETEIVDQSCDNRLIVARDNDMIGTKCGNVYRWTHISQTTAWTIHDPWEEITEECDWIKCSSTFASWYIVHKGKQTVCHDSKDYKTDGRRVWKRKEE